MISLRLTTVRMFLEPGSDSEHELLLTEAGMKAKEGRRGNERAGGIFHSKMIFFMAIPGVYAIHQQICFEVSFFKKLIIS